jgi:catechol 2,3-dioxygenase-like lactoylglutathione lyase family enzyme
MRWFTTIFRKLCVQVILLLAFHRVAAQELQRPAITGIRYAAIQVSDAGRSRMFYEEFLGYSPGKMITDAGTQRWQYRLSSRQWIYIRDGLSPGTDERLLSIAFQTANAEALRIYLERKGVEVPSVLSKDKDGNLFFTVADPDKHAISFVEPATGGDRQVPTNSSVQPVSVRILHAGLTIADTAAASRFYRDILGFSEIWRGGATDSVVSWLNMRVPDGTDYLEYMLVKTPVSRQQLGSLHHIALMVPDMQAAIDRLQPAAAKTGWLLASPRIGRNNRWQLNLFDADGTRIELMEPFPMR